MHKYLARVRELKNKFNPLMLTGHLARDETGSVIFDKRALKTHLDCNAFVSYLLHTNTLSISDAKNSTLYFDVDKDRIICGVYNLITKKKGVARIFASVSNTPGHTWFLATKSELNEMIKRIAKA